MTDIKDVAARAGVSVATVSRVLNANPRVSSATRERVVAAMEELGYRPNAVARSLRIDETRVLGLVLGDILNPFFTALARGVEDEARTAGYTVVICNADEDPDEQDHYVRVLLEQQVDGLLLCPTAEVTSMVRAAVRSAKPLVFVDRVLPELDVPSARVDGTAAIHALVAHLRDLGYRRIAFISGPPTLSTGRERSALFLEAMRANGLATRPEYLEAGDFRAASGREITARFLALPEPPEVIVVGDNLMTLGALDAVRERGLHIPADMAIASYDDVPWFAHLDPPMTAISQPVAELGARAVRTLLELIRTRTASSTVLSASLVVRRSCGEPPAGRANAEDEKEIR